VEVRISQSTEELVWQASIRSILWGVVLNISGVLGGSVLLASVSVNLVIAWLIVLRGMAHLIIAHHAHRAGSVIWRLLIGFAYVFFGMHMIARPALTLASLTLLLALLFLFEGIFDIALFFRLRRMQGSSLVLLDGVVTSILGLMISLQWPSNHAQVDGILVCLSLFTTGVTRVLFSLVVRNAMARGKSRDDSSDKEYWATRS
jgi:uncharacterized membrane protein HdeD (DUF308 family)